MHRYGSANDKIKFRATLQSNNKMLVPTSTLYPPCMHGIPLFNGSPEAPISRRSVYGNWASTSTPTWCQNVCVQLHEQSCPHRQLRQICLGGHTFQTGAAIFVLPRVNYDNGTMRQVLVTYIRPIPENNLVVWNPLLHLTDWLDRRCAAQFYQTNSVKCCHRRTPKGALVMTLTYIFELHRLRFDLIFTKEL